MKKIFIDCGSNLGQGFESIKQLEKINHNWDVFMFEPNPHCINILKNKYSKFNNIHIYHKGVYSENCITDFYITSDLKNNIQTLSQGSKISKVKDLFTQRSNLYGYAKPIKTELIKLSEFINDLKHCEIIIKIDTEGSEFAILNDLIRNSNLDNIKKIYVEFHTYAIDSDKKEYYLAKEAEIIEYFKKTNTKLINWI